MGDEMVGGLLVEADGPGAPDVDPEAQGHVVGLVGRIHYPHDDAVAVLRGFARRQHGVPRFQLIVATCCNPTETQS